MKLIWKLWLIVPIALTACHSQNESEIMTVLGPISASEMGTILQHEHILVDFIGADSTGFHRWDKQNVVDKALPYLLEVRSLGCKTFIDCTPAYLGRDPGLLRTLAEKTGMNIITNTGYYGARNNKFIPAKAFEMSAEELAQEWISEFRNGIEETGIRPGFIKIAVDQNDSLSAMHGKIIRAAALTHLETGLVIMSHTGTDQPAFNQLAKLEALGVKADAFIWTHAQAGTPAGWIKAAKMGVWISLDNVNTNTLATHIKNLQLMKVEGLLNRVLISHDSGWYRVGEKDGGEFNGFTTIFTEFVPALKKAGFTDLEIRQLLVENPSNAFRLAVKTMK